MPKILHFLRKHAYIILLYIISIVIVCVVFPRGGMFPYEIQRGKIWGHGDLYAPFDIPILKTQQELDAERDSIIGGFVVYYNEIAEVAEQQKRLFRQTFDEQWSHAYELHEDINRLYQNVIAKFDMVYGRGILQIDETVGSSDHVVIIRNFDSMRNVAQRSEFDNILTPKVAYELIMDELNKRHSSEVMAFLRRLNLNNFIQPNLVFNADITNYEKNAQIARISYTKGVLSANRRIIERGEIVNDEKFNLLTSFRHEFENRVGLSGNFRQIWAGQAIIVIICFLLVFIYLMYFRHEIFCNIPQTAFLLLIMTLFIGLSCIVVSNDYFNLYAVPYVLIPIIICTFYDVRIANFVYWVTILLIGFIAPNGFEFVFLNFVAGLLGIVNIKYIHRRGSLFMSVSMVVLAYCVIYSAMVLMQGINVLHVDWMNYVRFAVSGTLIFVIYPSIFVFEKTFGFISNITLMELSDTNQPLLRKLSEVTPCTFQHSLQVANLSEEVIRKIGGNPMLVRTGALYHDIGKIKRPEYFIENQAGRNPHEDLSPEESAQIIIEHVANGIEIARKNRLPQHIIDFIRTHHGSSAVRYFLSLQQKLNADKDIDRSKFVYSGPVPFSKEMVALMMCDAIEAASRSLKEINHQTISDLVDNIVNYQMIEEQYNDANITYREINTAKQIIKNRLMNIYHARIEYPKD